MVRIELMSWEEARAQSSPIRFTVFCEEQGVPREIELDEHDAACVHALAFEGSKAVGTARLLPDGHIGRMAVLKEWRGQGIGGRVDKVECRSNCFTRLAEVEHHPIAKRFHRPPMA